MLVPFGTGEGATEAQSSKFTRLVGEELKNREELLIMDPPAVKESKPAPAAAPAKKSGAAAEASFALEAGKKALADLKFEEAMAQLKKGIEASLSDPATCDFPAVIDATISLAAAAFRAGDEKEAKNALQNLARLDPNYALPAGYPPIFTREFEKAKKKIDKSPKGSINVDGPSGATAFVDGRDLGMVPVLEESLAAGTHYVKVEGTHGEKFGQTVEVKAGTSKVKADFKGGGGAAAASEKNDGKGGVVEPKIASSLDDTAKKEVAAYAKAAGAEYALVGFVYRTGDQQLTAGPALYSVKKNGFVSILPVSFDDAVLTATVEAFKVVDGVQQRISSFGGIADLPLNLQSKSAIKVAAKSGGKSGGGDDTEGVTAERKALKRDAERSNLEPSDGTVRKLDCKSTLVDDSQGGDGEQPPQQEVKKGGVPTWVWIGVGVVVAAGAGVGGYFGYKEATKPVTGTVTATW
ncbi:MAG: PEGA domain-containing protein [Myxococcaceae bacterium]